MVAVMYRLYFLGLYTLFAPGDPQDPVGQLLTKAQGIIKGWAVPGFILTAMVIGGAVLIGAGWPSFKARHEGGFWVALFGFLLIVWAPVLIPWIAKAVTPAG
jgi:hypothetical protein